MKNDLIIRPLKNSEENEFRELTNYYIGMWYDDIDDSFSQMILDAHTNDLDPLGYFTKKKTIWVAEIKCEMGGFLVATEKRGGSIKLAPGIMKPEYQKQGWGTKLWRGIEEIYTKRGARKIYNHAPFARLELLKWVLSLGLEIEAHLKEQYRAGQDEYVAGKLLTSRPYYPTPVRATPSENNNKHIIREFSENDKYALEKLLLDEMPKYYDDIDESFVEAIVQGEKRFSQTFTKKGKKVFLVELDDKIVGCCVATPKRGGAIKLVPIIIREQFAHNQMILDLVKTVEDYFRGQQARKLYTLLPLGLYDILDGFRDLGFVAEGLIKEPYKAQIHNLFLGKLLKS